MTVPNIFANVTTSIPLSQLDTNFATAVVLGNTSVYLGNTTTTLGNVTLANANVTTALLLTGASGTSGQALTSAGANAAPTWTTIGASAATPTALGTVYGKTDSSALAFIGYNAGVNTSGTGNTALGYVALQTNTTGTYNTAVGWNAGQAATGSENTFVGVQAGAASTGSNNVAVGKQALQQNTSGYSNAAVGHSALTANTTGYFNATVGYNALSGVTTGAGNTAVGEGSGGTITTGTTGIYIGQRSAASGTSVAYEILIGCSTTGKGSNTGFINPNGGGVYQGNNSAAWSVTSDQRLKKNIVNNTEGLDVISQIRVRNFEYRTEEEIIELKELPAHTVIKKEGVQLGVIAQELQEICPDCIKTESTGVMSVNSDNVFWHMVNAIKDLKALNDTQAATITALTARIVALESK